MVRLGFLFNGDFFDRQVTGLKKKGRDLNVFDVIGVKGEAVHRQVLKFHDIDLLVFD